MSGIKYLNIGIAGNSGTGKTTIIKSINEKAKILILDVDKSLYSIETWIETNKERIHVKNIDTYEDIMAIFKQKELLESYQYVVVDSLSKLTQLIAKHYRISSKLQNQLEQGQYLKLGFDVEDILFFFRNLKANVIYTLQTDDSTDKYGDVFIDIDLVGNMATKESLRVFDFIFYLIKSNTNSERYFITENGAISEQNQHILRCCKKRDEFHVLSKVEPANLHTLLKKFVEKRLEIINSLKKD